METAYNGKCKHAPVARPEVKTTFYLRRQKERSRALYWPITIACFVWAILGVWSTRDQWKPLLVLAVIILMVFLGIDLMYTLVPVRS